MRTLVLILVAAGQCATDDHKDGPAGEPEAFHRGFLSRISANCASGHGARSGSSRTIGSIGKLGLGAAVFATGRLP
jgi:hypothetical protein